MTTIARAARLAPARIFPFITGGDAIWTIVSPSGARFTFRTEPLCAPERDGGRLEGPVDRWVPIPGAFKVSLLTGPDNSSRRCYNYIGTFRTDRALRGPAGFSLLPPKPGKAAAASPNAPSAKAAAFLLNALVRKPDGSLLPPGLQVLHAGRCGYCGRLLTVPSSIETGIGPVCAEKMAA